jgi:hypothetical protein
MTQEEKPRLRTPALTIAVCIFIAAILISLFRWTLVQFLTPFIEPILEIAIGVLFLASLVWSAVYLARARKQSPRVALLPLAVNVITIVVVTFVPFSLLTTQLDFRVHYGPRMAVVSNVLDGRYEALVQNRGGRGDFIALPAQLSYLSSGGRYHPAAQTKRDFDFFRRLPGDSGQLFRLCVLH